MKVTTRKGKAFLKPDGELTVARAADLKDALVKSIEKADTIEINLADASLVDLACLQLLCSAHRTAAKKGKIHLGFNTNCIIIYHENIYSFCLHIFVFDRL